MGATARVTVLAPDDVLSLYGAGAAIRLERSATEAGSYTEVATQAVVDGVFSYEFDDAGGSSSSWYRSRFSTSSPTLPEHFSAYGDPFSASQPAAYATLDDLMITKRQNADNRYAATAERRLEDASRRLDQEIGYSVMPGVETTVVLDGDGSDRIHIHGGFTSVALLEVRDSLDSSWVALEAEGTGWILEGAPGAYPGAGEPYFHIRLLPGQARSTLPNGLQLVRLTYVPGWPAIPGTWRNATVAWARQMIDADPLVGGNVPAVEGAPYGVDRKPQAVWDLITAERHRHWCHL